MQSTIRSRLFDTFETERAFLSALKEHIAGAHYEVNSTDGEYRLLVPGHFPFPVPAPRRRRLFSKRQRTFYEPVTTALVDFLLTRFTIQRFFDIGAREGYFSLLTLSYRAAPPIVDAFEMGPTLVEKMQALARSESYCGDRWHPHLAAVTDHDEGGSSDLVQPQHVVREGTATRGVRGELEKAAEVRVARRPQS